MHEKLILLLRKKSAAVRFGGVNELVPNGAMSHNKPKPSATARSMHTMNLARRILAPSFSSIAN
jgi:hypothetical protein